MQEHRRDISILGEWAWKNSWGNRAWAERPVANYLTSVRQRKEQGDWVGQRGWEETLLGKGKEPRGYLWCCESVLCISSLHCVLQHTNQPCSLRLMKYHLLAYFTRNPLSALPVRLPGRTTHECLRWGCYPMMWLTAPWDNQLLTGRLAHLRCCGRGCKIHLPLPVPDAQ